jgi:hypothetical protein
MAESIYYSYKDGKVGEILAMTESIAEMLAIFKKGEDDCKIKHTAWKKIDEFIQAWRKPKNFQLKKDQHIIINGIDLFKSLK